MIPHPVAVPPDVDDVAVMDQPVDQGRGEYPFEPADKSRSSCPVLTQRQIVVRSIPNRRASSDCDTPCSR